MTTMVNDELGKLTAAIEKLEAELFDEKTANGRLSQRLNEQERLICMLAISSGGIIASPIVDFVNKWGATYETSMMDRSVIVSVEFPNEQHTRCCGGTDPDNHAISHRTDCYRNPQWPYNRKLLKDTGDVLE